MSESVFSTVDETPPVDDDSRLRKLLQEFQLESVFDYLKAAQVSYRSLQYMQAEDIKEAIPPLGLRIEFREKLFTWKKVQFGIDDETISVQSKVDNWLKEKEFHGKHVLNKDYYFIRRGEKGSPSGKLYSKYKNFRAKRLKYDNKASIGDASNERKSSSDQLSSQIYENIEVDESIASALKVSLNRDSADWSDVCEKWKKTFHLRRQELSELNSGAFLESWSKFSHQKAADLIQIDFELLYPGKSHMLFSKWQNFKGKILGYYERNVTNEACKQQISKAKETQQIDSEDYLITILLNSIFPSSARFKNKQGKKTLKVTIVDSQDSFVLRLTTLNDYQRKIEETVNKYYSVGLTLQPFLILEDSPDEQPKMDQPIDMNIALSCLHHAYLGKFSLLYAGEVQGIISDKMLENINDMDLLNQCRFVFSKQMWEWSKKEYKFLRYWIQSRLSNVDDIYVACKDKEGIVKKPIEHCKVSDIPKNYPWEPEVCFGFLHAFLEKVENLMHGVNSLETVYEFQLNPPTKKITYEIYNGRTDKTFIPKYYADFVNN